MSPPPAHRQDPFLVPPTRGYEEPLDEEVARALESAYLDLIRGGDPQSTQATARDLERYSEQAGPVSVLSAQAHLAAGECTQVLDRLAETVAERPRYVAAQLLVGRCREDLGDLPGAAGSYASVRELHPLAEARLGVIEVRARDAAVDRIRGWIAAGRADEAGVALADLRRWAPTDEETLTEISDLASALGNRRLELDIVRSLVGRGLAERALLQRQAELEIDVGDAGAGLEILEGLQRQFPEDPSITESLGHARFAWRMTMLPPAAQSLASSPELNRGQWAVLLYWIFPGVRYTRPVEAIIANDVLDHAHRDEIVRVVNLGIMEVDASLHAFRPEDGAQRLDALRSLLRVLEASSRSSACLAGASVPPGLSVESTCQLAASCGLLDEPAECLPEVPLSGSTAMHLARGAAHLLERQ